MIYSSPHLHELCPIMIITLQWGPRGNERVSNLPKVRQMVTVELKFTLADCLVSLGTYLGYLLAYLKIKPRGWKCLPDLQTHRRWNSGRVLWAKALVTCALGWVFRNSDANSLYRGLEICFPPLNKMGTWWDFLSFLLSWNGVCH